MRTAMRAGATVIAGAAALVLAVPVAAASSAPLDSGAQVLCKGTPTTAGGAGTNVGETLTGDGNADKKDVMQGLGGDDDFMALTDADLICGGPGADTIMSGSGDDTAYGGSEADDVNGDEGNDRLFGESGNDTLNGGPGDDRLDGGSGHDECTGGGGHDTYVSCERRH